MDAQTSNGRESVSAQALRVSLRNVIAAICFGMVFFTITMGPATTGFARELGASDFVFGLFMALPVLGGVAQVFASMILERTGRRKSLFISFLYPQRLIWIPIALVPLVFPEHLVNERIWTVIGLIFMASLCGSVGNVAFMSWMGDLVPRDMRGRFFGKRSAIATLVAVVAAWFVGLLLDALPGMSGYMMVLMIAAVFGTLDVVFFHFVSEPPMDRETVPPKLKQTIMAPFRSAPFRKFVFFWCSAMFSTLILGPFITVYLLEVLELGFRDISLYIQVIPNMAIFLAAKWWGSVIDVHGCKPVLTIAMAVHCLTPIGWFFTTADRWILMIILNFLGGFFWSAMDLGSLNMLMRSTPDRNRSAYVANFSLLTGVIGNALSYIVAGIFLSQIRPLVESLQLTVAGAPITRFHLLFLLACSLRIVVTLFILPRLDDPGASNWPDVIRSTFLMKIRRPNYRGYLRRPRIYGHRKG